ncbi:MAG: cupin domain-containing protein [Burkholderiales bacterium]
MRIPNRVVLASLMASTAIAASAAEPSITPADLIMSGPEAVAVNGREWKESKTVPPGMKVVMVLGDPSKPGPYVFRAMIPAGYKLPPHRHPDERSVIVLKGTYWSGVGENFDKAALKKFTPGNFYITDARTPHFATAETDVIIQEMGIGPIENPIEFLRAEDAPR